MYDFHAHIDPFLGKRIQDNAPWFYTVGIVLILLGALALSSTVGVTLVSVLFLGWLLIISGIAEVVHSFWSKGIGSFFLNLLAGIFGIVVGGLMIANPGLSALSLTLVFGVYFIVEGAMRSIIALYHRGPFWGWLLFNGIVTLLLGILIIAQWPTSGLWVIGLFIGTDLIISGWSLIVIPLMAKKLQSIPTSPRA
jgi:uncharacterized membrane protein HdeD (DUF308 family)